MPRLCRGMILASHSRMIVSFRMKRYSKSLLNPPVLRYLSCPISSAKEARIVRRRGSRTGIFGPRSQAVKAVTINPNPKHGRSTFPARMTPATMPENMAEEKASNEISEPIRIPLMPDAKKHMLGLVCCSLIESASFSAAPANGQMVSARIRLDIAFFAQLDRCVLPESCLSCKAVGLEGCRSVLNGEAHRFEQCYFLIVGSSSLSASDDFS